MIYYTKPLYIHTMDPLVPRSVHLVNEVPLLSTFLPCWSPFLVQTNGKTYEDLCIKGTDGATCEQNSRSVTRFWDDNFDTYEVRVRLGLQNVHVLSNILEYSYQTIISVLTNCRHFMARAGLRDK